MKRRAFKVFVFLLIGAIINVAVAWGCARFGPYETDYDADTTPTHSHRLWWQSNAPVDSPLMPEFLRRGTKFGATCEILHTGLERPGWIHMSRCRSGWPTLSCEGSLWFIGADEAVYGRGILPFESPNPIPFTPLWPGFAINTIFYAVVLWVLLAAPFKLGRWRRIKRGECASCGYSLL